MNPCPPAPPAPADLPGTLDPDLLAGTLLAAGEQLVRLSLLDPARCPTARLTDFITSATAYLAPPRHP
ncbi:hypothetical protein [Nocardia sp. NPDC127526]|uniref:hypothetical protein n=1 Tax=Nocardia sp. NPDC127526 TaxID=3345393 RepID=UPI00363216C9